MKNDDTLILLRSLAKIDGEVLQKCQELRQLFPNVRIVISADCMLGQKASGFIKEVSELGVSLQEVTQESLLAAELPYIGHQTGWLCGDYRLYLALKYPWERIWMIEPDVGFVNGAGQVLQELVTNLDVDLLAPRLRKAEDWWAWQDRLRPLTAYPDMYAMQFPLLGASRELVKSSFHFRRRISLGQSFSNATVPNDESVLATVAGNGDFYTHSLNDVQPNLMKHFGTVPKYLIGDLEKWDKTPSFVHSLVDEVSYWRYAEKCLDLVAQNNPAGEDRFNFLKREASEELKAQLCDFENEYAEKLG